MSRFLHLRSTSTSVAPVIAVAAAIVTLVLIAVVATLHWFITQRTEAVANELVVQAATAFEEVPPFTNDDARALRQFPNRQHVERARTLGIARIPDRDTAERMLASSGMVELHDTEHYVVLDLGYSVPFVTRDAANLLDIIGRRFHAKLEESGLPRYRFLVTSATRTDDDQRRLRRVNANAAENSSHFHGTTVDIHYARYDYDISADFVPAQTGISRPLLERRLQRAYASLVEDHHPKLKAILAEVMREVQDAGLVMVTYERMQPVYHITVNRPIPEPAIETDLALHESSVDDEDGVVADASFDVATVAAAR